MEIINPSGGCMALDLLGIFIADLLFAGLIFLYIWLTLRFRRARKGPTRGEDRGRVEEAASEGPER